MINQICHEVSSKVRSYLLLCAVLFTGAYANAQSTTVLPNNASYSNKTGPQGALRYQRGFYLVTPAEMNSSGITNGMNINSIGFTIGSAQGDTTKGRFRLFLQNSADVISRADTGWNSVSASTNEYNATGLFPGKYEWQVKANCASSSAFTSSVFFSNDELSGCNNPYNLNTVAITPSAATLSWEAAGSPVFSQYRVEYTALDVINWVTATTTDTFFNVSGLTAGKTYQWRVKMVCTADSSAVNYANFTTGITTSCNNLSGLSATVTQDSLVALSWTADATASFYEIQFRRTGTEPWSNSISVTNSANLVLPAGTSYQWRVRIACAGNNRGAYTASTFTTGGTSICYIPDNPVTRHITATSARLTWTAVVGATDYTVRYRLKNAISWTNAVTPMTMACDSVISIPDTTGAYDIPFHGGSPFTYTGGGLYIAWEYSRPTGNLVSPNLTLSTTKGTSIQGANGQDSLTYLLCMISRADTGLTALPDIMGESRQRPETRLGSASLNDSVAVLSVYALGMTVPKFQSPTPISALIVNKSATNKSYNVTLTVKEQGTGTTRYTTTQAVAVTATDTVRVQFNGWSPTQMESDSIIVSVPAEAGENVINNNSKFYLQKVNNSLLAYDDGTLQVSQAGFGTGSGLLLNKHKMNGCGQVIAAKVYLTESAKNNPVYAVIRNAAGAVVAQSASFTAAQADINSYHSFYFTSPASFSNEDFYIGIAQAASATAYYPVGAQWEDATTRDSGYFRAALDGSALVDYPAQGRLMIRAEVVPSGNQVFINGNLTLCTGGSNVLTAGSMNTRYANSVAGFSSQNATTNYSAAQALGSPDVYPQYGLSGNAWTSATAQASREWLVLGFPNPGKINYVDIFETANPGAVDSIFAKNPTTLNYELLYSATATAAPQTAR
ncbi:MAG TPA: fibronectin type III domain-containing protein, partial [Ferruginibacter sp.]|nr:fibronectin type III domain-containing protein [Ferruginibacter sp.]